MPPGRPRKNQDDMLLKSADVIGWAVGGIEREIAQTRERLSKLLEQAAVLRRRVGGPAPAAPAARTAAPAAGPAAPATKRRRRKMSAEARKKISDNLKKRWADAKKAGKSRLQPSR